MDITLTSCRHKIKITVVTIFNVRFKLYRDINTFDKKREISFSKVSRIECHPF